MKKLAKKTAASMLISLLAITLTGGLSVAEDKLIVEDGSMNKVFSVTDQGVVTSKFIGIGMDAPEAQFHVIDEAVTVNRGIVTGQHNSGVHAASIQFKKSRGSYAAPQSLVNGDYFGIFQAFGYDGSAYQRTAQFGFRSNGAVSAGSIPTDIVFWAGNNAASLTETLRLKSTGTVNMKGLAGSYSGGSAFVCVNNAGDIYASETACP